jgi:DNA polymerase II small subunit/DNA polymerase delta subunit B
MSQPQILTKHFSKRATITQLEATMKYRIMRLSERIREMEEKGWQFNHVKMKGNNACGAVGQYCKYVLVKRPK